MHKIKKAIIPVAGLATRMYPMSKFVKKAFLPVIDLDGRIKPLILKLLEELHKEEIEEIYLIIGKNEEKLYKELFSKIDEKIYNKISEEDKLYEQLIMQISAKVKYIVQEEPLGFAHAVYLAKKHIKNEPFILLLGDTIYKSDNDKSCLKQMLEFYDMNNVTTIGLHKIKEEELKYYGTAKGKWENSEKDVLLLETIVEKPTKEYAKKNLIIDGNYYGNFGMFILEENIFKEIEINIGKAIEGNKEYQLMDAIKNIIKKESGKGLVIKGKSFDMGNIEGYKKVMREF